jgi:hypothetical protein
MSVVVRYGDDKRKAVAIGLDFAVSPARAVASLGGDLL